MTKKSTNCIASQRVTVDTARIPQWSADELASGLLRDMRNWFSVPENREKFEAWMREQAEG